MMTTLTAIYLFYLEILKLSTKTFINNRKGELEKMEKKQLRHDPDKNMIFVIGDCKGDIKLLRQMFAAIDSYPNLAANDKIVILGNIFSEDTKNCQEAMLSIRYFYEKYKDQVVIIRGAKEHRLICNKSNLFKESLGRNFLNSYRNGVKTYYGSVKRTNFLKVKELVNDLKWLAENTVKYYKSNKFFFCSCGINTTRTLEEQYEDSLMYVKLAHTASDKTIKECLGDDLTLVHGCGDGDKPIKKLNRICMSSKNNTLSCFILDDTNGGVCDTIKVETQPLKLEFKRSTPTVEETNKKTA